MNLAVAGIYRIDGPNGKFYVGSAKHIGRRWTEHKRDLRKGCHANPKLQCAWNCHGESRFTLNVLEPVANLGDLIVCEQFWIDTLDAVNAGYNVLPTAGSSFGKKASDATRRKMSAAALGRRHGPMSAEQKAHYSRLYTGRKFSEETRRRMSLSRMGRKFSKETLAKISEANTGRVFTGEHRDKLAMAKRGRKLSAETRARMSASHQRRLRQITQPILS